MEFKLNIDRHPYLICLFDFLFVEYIFLDVISDDVDSDAVAEVCAPLPASRDQLGYDVTASAGDVEIDSLKWSHARFTYHTASEGNQTYQWLRRHMRRLLRGTGAKSHHCTFIGGLLIKIHG